MLEDLQRSLAEDSLAVLAPRGFALAGSGAIREHGLISRPTEDIDLFGSVESPEEHFDESVGILINHLTSQGYDIRVHRRSTHFFSAEVERNGSILQLDMGIDYREFPPARLNVGAVLDVRDAVANKLGAMCSRGEPRDYLDTDAIRQSGLFNDSELLALTLDHDPGLSEDVFAQCLAAVSYVTFEEVERYGYDEKAWEEAKGRLIAWAYSLK